MTLTTSLDRAGKSLETVQALLKLQFLFYGIKQLFRIEYFDLRIEFSLFVMCLIKWYMCKSI